MNRREFLMMAGALALSGCSYDKKEAGLIEFILLDYDRERLAKKADHYEKDLEELIKSVKKERSKKRQSKT